MKLFIKEDDNILYFKQNDKEKIFLKFTINILFFGKNDEFASIICDKQIDIQEFKTKLEQSYFILIFGFNFKNQNVIDEINKILDLKILKFIIFDLFYISGVYNFNNELYLDFENIYENNIDYSYDIISYKNFFNFKNTDFSNDNNLKFLNDNIKSIINEVEELTNKIKDYSIEDLQIKTTYLNNKYLKLDELINRGEKFYKIILKKLDELEKNISDKNTESKDLIHKDFNFEKQNKYVLTILKLIENLNNDKESKVLEIKKIESKLISKINNINKLNKDINDLDLKIKEKNIILKHINEKTNQKEFVINNLDIGRKDENENINIITNQTNKKTKTIYKKNSNTNIKNLGVFVHIFNINVWNDIYKYLKILNESNYNFDLYINIASSEVKDFGKNEYINLKNEIKHTKIYENLYITHSDNRGMDIGGFFTSYIKMLELNLGYENIIKIHTKTNNNWRFAMMYAILGNKSIIDNNFTKMNQDNIGMIGNQVIDLTNIINKNSYNFIHSYLKRFNVKFNNKGGFIPGTIFMIKGSVLRTFFNTQNLRDSYNEFEKDYCGSKINNREGKPHAFERFFGFMVDSCNMKTVSFDS